MTRIHNRSFLLAKKDIINLELLLITALSLTPLINISNTVIEQVVLCATLVLLVLLFFQNIQIIGKRMRFMIIYLNVVSIGVTMFLHGGFGSAVMAMNLILAAMIYNNIEIECVVYKRLHFIVAVVLTFYVLTADISYIWTTTVTDIWGNQFNSNMFAMFTLAAYLHWICFLFESRISGWKRTIIFTALSCAAIYYIWISKSRTAIIAILFFWGLFFFKKSAFENKKFRAMVVILLIANCVFPIVYVAAADKFANVTILGKSFFSGRQNVWKSAFESISKYPVFGSANDVLLRDVSGRMTVSTHNMMLGFMKMFGIIPSVTIILYLINNNANNRYGLRMKIPQFAFMATIPCVFFESFYTNSHLYMLFAFFMLEFIAKESKLE